MKLESESISEENKRLTCYPRTVHSHELNREPFVPLFISKNCPLYPMGNGFLKLCILTTVCMNNICEDSVQSIFARLVYAFTITVVYVNV